MWIHTIIIDFKVLDVPSRFNNFARLNSRHRIWNHFVNLLIVPNRSREVVVHQREYGLDIAIVQPVWGSLQVPPRNPRKSMLGSEGPSTELSCNCGKTLAAGGAKFLDLGKLTKDKGNPATYRLLAVERGQFAGGKTRRLEGKGSINSVRRYSKICQP